MAKEEENPQKNHDSQNPFANLDAETQQKIQELQLIEQGYQQLLQQKQMFQAEINETKYSLDELKKSSGEVFRIVGNQLILKSTKEEMEKELTKKNELIELRLKKIEEQEKELTGRVDSLRDEVMKKIK